MLISYTLGQTSIILRLKILDSAATTGAGKTGLAAYAGSQDGTDLITTSGLIIAAISDVEATTTIYTVAASHLYTIATLGTFSTPPASSARWRELDATNHKGIYELQLPNARYAVTGAKSLLVSISGATGGADCDVVIPLPTVNPYVSDGKLPVTLSSSDGADSWWLRAFVALRAPWGIVASIGANAPVLLTAATVNAAGTTASFQNSGLGYACNLSGGTWTFTDGVHTWTYNALQGKYTWQSGGTNTTLIVESADFPDIDAFAYQMLRGKKTVNSATGVETVMKMDGSTPAQILTATDDGTTGTYAAWQKQN